MEALRFNPDSPSIRKILLHLCISWIEDNDREYLITHPIAEVEDTLHQLFVILLDLFEIYKFPRHMFVPVVIYANRFVSKYGIKHNQLFNLLLTSTLIAMKFWDDTTPITNARIAESFRYSISEVRIMEQRFLKGLDYSFSLSPEDVTMFIFEAAKVELNCLSPQLPPKHTICTPALAPLAMGTARV
eukprot:Phypoly_transcript_16287.p1 GENE.Phypoly_transcript_16287~~Phypoly_transcript_16287.p1  ORF type:complete len:187 (+),score=30.29 Phypoly_transcript_16287:132-692(+)